MTYRKNTQKTQPNNNTSEKKKIGLFFLDWIFLIKFIWKNFKEQVMTDMLKHINYLN